MARPRTFDVVLHREETHAWVATVPALPGCVSQGATKAEARANIREAMELHLETFGDNAIDVAARTQAFEPRGGLRSPCLCTGRSHREPFERSSERRS